jgi:hypothetical protein
MTIEEIARYLEESHQALLILANSAVGPGQHGAEYQFSTAGGENVPTLDVLAAELRKLA